LFKGVTMRILSLIVVAAILGLAEPAHATTIMGPVIPTLDQVITPAGVSEYREAMTVAWSARTGPGHRLAHLSARPISSGTPSTIPG
jgi:hypothetical protein